MSSGHRDAPLSRRRFRRVAAFVLARDGHRCRMVDGCDVRATTVDHVVALVDDPARRYAYDPAYLRAACVHHNSSAGAALAGRRDLGTPSREWR